MDNPVEEKFLIKHSQIQKMVRDIYYFLGSAIINGVVIKSTVSLSKTFPKILESLPPLVIKNNQVTVSRSASVIPLFSCPIILSVLLSKKALDWGIEPTNVGSNITAKSTYLAYLTGFLAACYYLADTF